MSTDFFNIKSKSQLVSKKNTQKTVITLRLQGREFFLSFEKAVMEHYFFWQTGNDFIFMDVCIKSQKKKQKTHDKAIQSQLFYEKIT